MNFLLSHINELGLKLAEQVYLVALATVAAIIVGLPLGIAIVYRRALRGPIMGFANILQTIPSLALLTLFLPLFGIGMQPALLALFLYALLPIIRNTMTGLENLPGDTLEAAQSLGFTVKQRLWLVELPLALPVIMAGIRTATVISTGVATLAAFVGAGGLGDFINRGLAVNDTRLILLGAIPAALLALLLDFVLARIELWVLRRQRHAKKRLLTRRLIFLIVVLIFSVASFFWFFTSHTSNKTIRIATKNFTEQMILGEIMAQLIETKTDFKVERKFNLGSTDICQEALLQNEIDLYPEYTGTGLFVVLKRKKFGTPKQIYDLVHDEYQKQFDIIWLKPFGFANNYALAVHEAYAKERGIKTVSQLKKYAPGLVLGAPAEYTVRPDSGARLKKIYDIRFKHVREMQPTLMYEAIHQNQVDAITAFTTDGRIPTYKLRVLEDDKHAWPSYDAAPVIRGAFLRRYPEVGEVLNSLAGKIDAATMQDLNYQVTLKKRPVAVVAREFLQLSKG